MKIADLVKGNISDNFTISSRFFFAALVFLLAAYLVLFKLDYSGHELNGDEVAFVSSTIGKGWTKWFTEGYSQYFNIYREWYTPSSHFIKPSMNFIYWVEYASFGKRYYLSFAIFFVAILCAETLLQSVIKCLGISYPYLIFSVCGIFLVNPSLVNDGLINIPFQNDFWSGLFTLLAFSTLLRDRFFATLVFLFIAVFNKESAWFAPVAAALSWIVLYRGSLQRIQAIAFILPLATILVLRYAAFGSVFGGIDVNGSVGVKDFALTLARGLILWPMGTVDFRALGQAAGDRSSPIVVGNIIVILANCLFWATLIVATYLNRLRIVATFANAFTGDIVDNELDTRGRWTLVTFIFLVGALSFGVIAGQRDRYGGSIYPFLLIGMSLFIAWHTANRTWVRFAGWIWLIVLFASFVGHGIGWTEDNFVNKNRVEDKLRAILRSLSTNVASVYVINAPDTFSSPKFLNEAWGIHPVVNYMNQFVGCEYADQGQVVVSGNELTVQIPDCAKFEFLNVSNMILGEAINGPLEREGVGAYHFPDIRNSQRRLDPREIKMLDFGKTMKVDLKLDRGTVYIYYDWKVGDYRILKR